MSAQAAIRKYDDFILGNCKFMLSSPFDMDPIDKSFDPADEMEKKMIYEKRIRNRKRAEEAKEKDALAVIRYVVTSILRWTPEEAMEHMTPELMAQLHLDMLMRYIHIPPNVVKNDCRWIVHMAFPTETSYNEYRELIKIYDKIANGTMSRFPKGIFSGKDGHYRFGIILKEYISRNIPATCIRDLYELFGKTARGWNILRKAELFHSARALYATPLDALHDALGDEGDEFYYNYYQYLNVFDIVSGEQD